MGIGTTSGRNYPQSLSSKAAEPGVISYCYPNAEANGIPTIQGADLPVGAMGSCSSDLLAPPIPGGLQFEKVIVVVKEQPIRIASLSCMKNAMNELNYFLNFTMAQPGYLTP